MGTNTTFCESCGAESARVECLDCRASAYLYDADAGGVDHRCVRACGRRVARHGHRCDPCTAEVRRAAGMA